MTNYKEIVTKAVIGKGKRTLKKEYQLQTEEIPDTVLGCWVINHKFSGGHSNNNVSVSGSFDVNVWYSYDHDSKTSVSTKRFTYNNLMKMHLTEDNKLDENSEIIVRSLKQPTVVDVKIKDGIVIMNIETELGIEIVGNTKIKVPIEDEFDDYETIIDDNEIDDEIDKSVSVDYLE